MSLNIQHGGTSEEFSLDISRYFPRFDVLEEELKHSTTELARLMKFTVNESWRHDCRSSYGLLLLAILLVPRRILSWTDPEDIALCGLVSRLRPLLYGMPSRLAYRAGTMPNGRPSNRSA